MEVRRKLRLTPLASLNAQRHQAEYNRLAASAHVAGSLNPGSSMSERNGPRFNP